MSEETYNFIVDNLDKLDYDLVNGKIITSRGNNGTVCSSTGYLRVRVSGKLLQVHQVLAVVYFGESCIGNQINHKDGNKLNNRKDNLEPISQKENIKHQIENGWHNNPPVPPNRLSYIEAENIREEYSEGDTSYRKLAKKYGVTHKVIGQIVRRETYIEVP